MIESETTAAMTNSDLKRARFWIQRWRAIGGHFVINGDDACTVRTASDDPKLERHYAKAEKELVKELLGDKRKKANIFALVFEAAARTQPQQDNEPEPPTAA